MEIVGLNIYPVKSCHGISMREIEVQFQGAKYDREWMVVDANGKFVTQREYPIMAAIGTALEQDFLVLTHMGSVCKVSLSFSEGTESRVSVWKSDVSALDQGQEAADFFSRILGAPHRLVRYLTSKARTWDRPQLQKKGIVSFADAMPFLLTTTASQKFISDFVNKESGIEVPMNRYRPNIVVHTTDAWVEDQWKQIQIGASSFDVVGPCARCIVITTDQDTGARQGQEPLRSLARLRKQGNAIVFGMHLSPLTLGKVQIGDCVDLLADQS
jgi:uncharacterized protein